MVRVALVEFKSTDELLLPGLLYTPAHKTKKVAINLHGNGSSSVFYWAEEMNLFAEELNRRGIAFFPFNNRGAHLIMKLTRLRKGKRERIRFGTTYEEIKDCVKDIDGAVAFLRSQGFREFYLIGHSTGANKICIYSYYKPKNPVSKYVLLAGGDDTGLYYQQLGRVKFLRALKESQQAIRAGRGRQMAPSGFSQYEMSYQSLYDTINPDGDYNVFPFLEALHGVRLSKGLLFRHYRSIRKPTLVVYGSEEQYVNGSAAEAVAHLKRATRFPEQFTYRIIVGADHSFADKEQVLAKTVASWLARS